MPLVAVCVAVVAAAGWLAPRASATTTAKRLVVYSVAEQEQYVNNSDSRRQGVGNNPFGTFKDLGPTSTPPNGPFPGDESLFSFNLYSDRGVKHRIGTAVFTCQYNFSTNAFCDASYHLSGGDSLVAGGGFSFSASRFTLAVTGGTGRYADQSGTVTEIPSANHAQRVVFVLRPATAKSTVRSFFAAPGRMSFINNVDDTQRGQGHNPFGNYQGGLVPVPTNERISGPLAGDEANYSFALYGDAAKTHRLGSAAFVCQYGFVQGGFCDAALELEDGTLVAKGSYNFNARSYVLSIVGGTGSYRGARGRVDAAALGVATQARPGRRGVPMLQAQRFHVTLRRATATTQSLTQSAQPTSETFVANLDDETRGAIQNPFGIRLKVQGLSEKSGGPFAGDEALFSFNTFTGRARTGSAVYTCWYAFRKDAFCDATYQMKGGSLIAAGAVNFDSLRFTLAITGGTGRYRDATGAVDASPKGKVAQQLEFALDLP